MIVQSFGQLQPVAGVTTGVSLTSGGETPWYDTPSMDAYGAIYAAQPNIRIPVDFLAGNVAQLGLHVYRRVSDTDRVRLVDHELARWFAHPNPYTTCYRLIESLLGDLGVFFNAYWWKVPYQDDQDRRAIGLVRLPPNQMQVRGGILPRDFLWTVGGKQHVFDLSEIVYFNGYNPNNPRMGLSNVETLAHVVTEEAAASQHREYYWRNASRHEGVVERPTNAPKWTPAQKQAWREQWQQRFAGGINAGLVAVLEDGMQFKPTAFSPRDSEYIQGGKLRREVTAAQYQVPQPSIGILDHATYSNIREQRKQLYQDSLGPRLEMIVQEIERQLLPECVDTDRVYVEFNIAAKLAGSFEEQAAAIDIFTKRAIMTPNEARARLNLPSIKNDPTADQLAPQQGGPSDATTQPAETTPPAEDRADATAPEPVDATTRTLVASTVDATRARQQAVLAKYPAVERSSVFFAQIDRWNRELATDLAPLVGAEEAARVAVQTNVDLFTDLEQLEDA